MPFLCLLRWIGEGSNYSFLLSEPAGVGVVLSDLHDLARTRFFRDGVEENIEKRLDSFFEQGKSGLVIKR